MKSRPRDKRQGGKERKRVGERENEREREFLLMPDFSKTFLVAGIGPSSMMT